MKISNGQTQNIFRLWLLSTSPYAFIFVCVLPSNDHQHHLKKFLDSYCNNRQIGGSILSGMDTNMHIMQTLLWQVSMNFAGPYLLLFLLE